MNINHISKKPFIDLFNRTPCMPLLARFAFHDAGSHDVNTGTGGANADIRFKQVMSRNENKGL